MNAIVLPIPEWEKCITTYYNRILLDINRCRILRVQRFGMLYYFSLRTLGHNFNYFTFENNDNGLDRTYSHWNKKFLKHV